MRKFWNLPTVAALATSAMGVALLVAAPHQAQAAPRPTNATLRIQKGGDRTGPQTVAGLAGATFDFFAGTADNPPSASATPDFSCTTAANGQCQVDVPPRTGNGQGYWMRERTAPSGYSIAQTLKTAATASSPGTSRVYNLLFSGNVQANTLRTFPEAGTGSSVLSRGSFWPDIRDNPNLPGHCGLNMALLLDTSGSIGSDAGNVTTAANGFVDALTGTPSQIAVYSFAANASALLASTPVSDLAGANIVKTAIAGRPAPSGSTNWDQGLFQIAAAPTPFDAVVMLTDGNPTVYGPPPATGPGNETRFREVENGIFSANALKAEGTKVVAVGVGAGVAGAPDNLKAISGPVAGSDYVQTDYAQLEEVFRQLARQTCAGTISVVKKVIPPGGTTADATPTGGWTFSTPTPDVSPSSGQTAGGTGAISFNTLFPVGSDTKAVTIDETQQPGFTLHPVNGQNATCTKDGQPASSTNAGATGFTTNAVKNSIVTCIVYNDSPIPPAQVQVLKKWDINGTRYDDPDQPPAFQALLSLTGQVDPSFGTVYNGYLKGDKVTVGEDVLADDFPPNCTNVESGDLGRHTLTSGLNVFHVKNKVTCTQKLTLFKNVINPFGTPAPKTDWTLSAYPDGSGTPAFSGTDGVGNDQIDANSPYSLGETTVNGYKQEKVSGATITPPSTGSWHCVLRMRDGSTGPEFDGLNGTVTVQLGESAECTANNTAQPARLTLKKIVQNDHGGTATRTDWILHAKPTIKGTSPTPISGRDGQPSVTHAKVNPLVEYTLTETDGPANYLMVGVPTCHDDDTGSPVGQGGTVTPQLGESITCEFTNMDQPGPPTPTPTPTPPMPPTGNASGPLAATGAGLFLAGASLFFVARRSRRTDED